ncbi:hypothetical protein WICPIJ_004757 [Wickerhamomyces pijperi]|uniref:Manganese/iron superoxide dismutase C-terminal domain-containing protein n=1 Tax=Wickerhamomyces pijperi TaxID=599730 RepID=A0A9P8Q734_WICPI|nr:hypothetical protein WICPIJ_004757 [Wickerhamomyces pijperi]
MLRSITQRRLQSTLASSKDSIKGLLSTEGFQTAYTSRLDYHSAQLKNAITSKNYNNATTTQAYAEIHAKDSANKEIFQHSSSLYNLEFAYKRLAENRDPTASIGKPTVDALFETPKSNSLINNQPTGALLKLIDSSFGSVEEFKTLLLQSAQAINGDGYTWVIAQLSAKSNAIKADLVITGLNIVNTYNAGSPLNISSSQIANIERAVKAEKSKSEKKELTPSTVIMELDQIAQYSTMTSSIAPLVAVDASPKAYLKDYGVYGKAAYLENLWNSIDWDVVLADVEAFSKKSKKTSFISK